MKITRKQQGFTIVELLIVVVIIGILAAIVIVAYNGITNRAHSSKSAATASSVVKKVEAYNGDKSTYPATYSLLTASADSKEVWYIPQSSYTIQQADVSSSSPETTFNYGLCTGGGYRVQVFDYANNNIAKTYGGGASADHDDQCSNAAS